MKVDYIEVDFDNNYVLYQRTDFMNLTLAYATTIHKAQGGEYSLVIMPLVQAFNRMLQRNLLYTGLTRAKDSLVLLGEPGAYQQAAQTEGAKRKTMLPTRLEKALVGILPKGPTQKVEVSDQDVAVDRDNKVISEKGSKTESIDDITEPGLNHEQQSIAIKEEVPVNKNQLKLAMIQAQTIDPNVGMMGVSPYDFM